MTLNHEVGKIAKMGCLAVADRKARPRDYINPSTGVQLDDLHDENAVIESGTGAIAFLEPMEGMNRTSKSRESFPRTTTRRSLVYGNQQQVDRPVRLRRGLISSESSKRTAWRHLL